MLRSNLSKVSLSIVIGLILSNISWIDGAPIRFPGDFQYPWYGDIYPDYVDYPVAYPPPFHPIPFDPVEYYPVEVPVYPWFPF